jgi:peptide/nickel transport system substrate-binding protein
MPHLALKAVAATTLAAIAATSLAQAPTPLLRLRLNADIRSTDPGVNRDFNTDVVVLHMVEGLVGMREDTTPGPLLASKIETSKDGKTYTFRLRDGVTFHNGAPLTADDVVWSWKRYLAPATQWRCLPDFDGRGIAKVTGVSAPDAKTVVFTLEKPTALFLTTMARLDCGGSGIVHRSSVGADGKWTAPIGTGPFKLGEWKRGQYVELQRFATYASRGEPMDGLTGGKKAEVERLRFLVIPDEAAAKAALLSNGIDLLTDIGVAQLGDLNGQPNVVIEKSTTANLNAILIQTRDPLLKDVRIRRALALAIDTPELVRGVTNALARPNNSMIPIVSPYYSAAQAVGFKSDIAQAKKLLAEAGYTGQPIKMLTNKRYMASYDTAVLAQAFAARAGIKIDIEVLDWATQLDRYTKGDYQTQAFSYSPRLDPSLSFEMVTGPKDSQPRKVWDNPLVQAKLVESMEITDKVKRQALLDDLHKRMLDEVPLIPLYNGLQFVAANKRVQGLRTWPAEVPRLWNVRLR